MKKAQVSMEFSILLAIMFMVFLAYLGVIYDRTYDIAKASDRQLLEQVGDIISIEIDTAYFTQSGFRHEFKIPKTIRNKEYEIQFCPKYSTYTSETVNTPGPCPVTKPEISLKYKGGTTLYVSNLPTITVGTDLMSAGQPITNICLAKEGAALYINSPVHTCP